MELNEVLTPPRKREHNVAEVARLAGVSRNTVYAVRRNPNGSTLDTILRVLAAMGYRVEINLVKMEDRTE